MMGADLRLIWEEAEGNRSRVLGGVDTTFDGVKQVLSASGKSPADFNALISGAKVVTGMAVGCILWCSGMGWLFQGLKDRGLCVDLCKV